MGITQRRLFLVAAWLTVVLGSVSLTIASRADAAAEAECHARGPKHADCGVHNMMIVGKQTIFLSHLSMFVMVGLDVTALPARPECHAAVEGLDRRAQVPLDVHGAHRQPVQLRVAPLAEPDQ